MFQRLKHFIARHTYKFSFRILGADGRPKTDTYAPLIEPDANKDFVFKQFNEKNLKNMRVSDGLRTLIKANTTLDAIVDIHQTFSVRDYNLTTDVNLSEEISAEAKARLQTYLDEEFGGYKSFRGFLKQMAYYRLAEGGIAIRITYDEDTLRPKMNLLSPLSLVYTYVNEEGRENGEGKKYLIIGKKITHNRIEIYYDERRSVAENMNFVYVPTNIRGDQVFGSSQMATVLRPAHNRQKISEQLADYLQKVIYPYVIPWIDTSKFFRGNSNITVQQVQGLVKEAADALKKDMGDRDETQDIVASAPVDVTELTGVSKAKLDGLDTVIGVYEPEIVRGGRVPPSLLGGQQRRAALNDTEPDVQWVAFSIRNEDAGLDIGEACTRAFIPIRLALDIAEHVGLAITSDNLESKRIEAEVFNLLADGYTKLINAGIITPEQAAGRLSENSLDFTDLEYEGADIEPDSPEGAE